MAPVAHCRTCGAPILWGRTAATGRLMALDREPCATGSAWFGPDRRVHVLGKRPAPAAAVRYVPHVITCRVRAALRRTKASAAAAAAEAEYYRPPAQIAAELREIAPHLARLVGERD